MLALTIGPAAVKDLRAVFRVQLPPGHLRDTIEKALAAAASVHAVRDGAEIVTVSSHPTMTEVGLYMHEQGGKPLEILVNENAADPGLTLLHEVGHYLDQHAIELPGYASVHSDLAPWLDAVMQSQHVADLIEHWLNPPNPPDPALATVVAGAVRKHVEYLLGPRELFARSYCQYVSVRSGDAALLSELQIALQSHYREQWHEDDFEPIGDALDDFFDGIGWR
jgi:hypothetical protein